MPPFYGAYEALNMPETNHLLCFISYENTATLYPVFSYDTGVVRLQISEKYLPPVDKILNNSSQT